MEDMVLLENVTKSYSEFTLDRVCLSVPRGCITGILGPNGAGKTTLIRLIMGHQLPDHGSIRLFGLDYETDEKAIKNRIGFVGETQAFYERKTVAWLGRFASRFFEGWDEEAFQGYLSAFGLPREKAAAALSKGMRVRLSLALALSHRADLLVLDEPTAGLDPVFRREVLDLLQDQIVDETRSVIVTSHNSDDLERIADRVGFLIGGRLVLEIDKEELLTSWKRIHFRPEGLGETVRSRLIQVKEGPFGSSGITQDFARLAPRLEEALTRGDVKVENIALDDALIALVKGD